MNMIGPAIVLGLGCAGSAIGCGIAGMASHGAMTRVEEGHGKFIALSAAPSTQAILGFVLMVLMKGAIQSDTVNAISGIGIGLFVGLALLISAVYQGRCAATAIQATAKQPATFGKCFLAIGIVESFAIFAFVFGMMLLS
ncbi:MAG TPA: ATP synthase subunit C [Chlamydiales bacterium]|nr:ATP synthase subunit C [Chlamydiales bacterium]